MTLVSAKNLLKTLQTQVPRGGPVDSGVLKSQGILAALSWYYVKNGWLKSLGRGVFMFPNDELQRDACLNFLGRRFPGLHVGGKTALAWRGFTHNLVHRETLQLWGEKSGRLPAWFISRFPSRYVAKHLFSDKLPGNFALGTLPETPDGPLVSEPERALLELLSEVGVAQSVDEARQIMETVRSPRDEVLERLLKNCRRVKVVRLCVQWAEEMDLEWAPVARRATKGQTGRSRWSTRLKEGGTLILKP